MRRRRGLAIPLAAGFAIVITIMIAATAFVRTGAKRQSRASFQAMKAHYLAQGAIQVALLKFRVLPNEGFEASDAAKNGDDGPLGVFLSDVGTEDIPLTVAPEGGTWTASIREGRALNAAKEGDHGDWIHVVQLTAVGEVNDGFRNEAGQVETRTEEVVKTVEVRKQRD